MGSDDQRALGIETGVTVRYWAAARAAAGLAEEVVPAPTTVDALREEVLARHPGDRLASVIAVCSVLVDGRQPVPQPGATPGETRLEAGSVVEFLPPFAGG